MRLIFMTISKAVEKTLKFIEINSEKPLVSEEDITNFDNDLKAYLKSDKAYHEVNYKLSLAEKKGYIIYNYDAETVGDSFEPTDLFTDYILEREKNFSKFLYGLIGSVIAVAGGLIGALITALV